MEFFQKLAENGNVDVTIRIMQKNDKLTLNIMPGSGNATIQPIIVTGTPVDLDAGFFNVIIPAVNEVKGLISNIEQVKKEAETAAKPKEPVKKEEKQKPSAKNNPKKKVVPQPVEASLFDEDGKNDTTEIVSDAEDKSEEDDSTDIES